MASDYKIMKPSSDTRRFWPEGFSFFFVTPLLVCVHHHAIWMISSLHRFGAGQKLGLRLTWSSRLWFSQSSCIRRRMGCMMVMVTLISFSSWFFSPELVGTSPPPRCSSESTSRRYAVKAFFVAVEASRSCSRTSSVTTATSFTGGGETGEIKVFVFAQVFQRTVSVMENKVTFSDVLSV